MLEFIVTYTKEQMATNQFFSGAVVATLLGSVLIKLKSVPTKIWERLKRVLVFRVTVYKNTDLFLSLEDFFTERCPNKYRNVEAASKRFGDDIFDDAAPSLGEPEEQRPAEVTYTHLVDSFVFWYKGRPLLVEKGREKLEAARDAKSVFLDSFRISSVFGKKLSKDLIEEAYRNKREKDIKDRKINIHASDDHYWRHVGTSSRDIESVVLPKDTLRTIKEDLEVFLYSRERYERLGIPYKRTYLLHGPPGNGKTSLTLALASKLKKDIYYLNLSTVSSDSNLQSLFSSIGSDSILIIEDIDTILKGREPAGKVTFSAVLNCMDGIFFKEGLITILTTNITDALDSALLRKGRVDCSVLIDNPSAEQASRYLSVFYEEPVELESLKPGISMSSVVDICLNYSKEGAIHELS